MTTATTTRLLQITPVGAIARVNLLPQEIAEARRLRKVQIILAGAMVGTIGLLALLYISAVTDTSDAQSGLDAAQARQATLQREVTARADVRAVYDQVALGQQTLGVAMGQEVQWSHYLTDLSLTLPSNVWVTSWQMTQNAATAATTGAPAATPVLTTKTPTIATLTFAGVALSHDDVAQWLEVMARQTGYENPYLGTATESQIGDRTVVNFTATIQVDTSALSLRYLKTGA